MAEDILQRIWDRQASFNANFRNPNEMDEEARNRVTKDLFFYMIDEVMEGVKALDWKDFRRDGQFRFSRSNLTVELIDCAKYLFTLMQLWGMTKEEFLHEFERKSKVVEQRYRQEVLAQHSGKRMAAVDLDGVLADFQYGFAGWVLRTRGTDVPTGFESQSEFHQCLCSRLGLDAVKAVQHEFREGGGLIRLPVIAGAKEFLASLRELGYSIAILSARPVRRYKRVMADTLEWLDNNGLAYDAVYMEEDKASKIVRDLPDTEFAVEDDLSQALEIAGRFCKVYLKRQNPTSGAEYDCNGNIVPFSDLPNLGQIIFKQHETRRT